MDYKQLYKYFKPYKSRFFVALFCMAIVSGLTGLIRYLLKPMIDKVFIAKDMHSLYFIVCSIPIAYFLLGLFNYGKNYFMSYIAQRITLNIRNKSYEQLQRLSTSFYSKGTTGKIMSRLTNDISALQFALNRAPATLVCDGLTVIVLIVMLFYLNWKFALISFIVFPFVSFPIINFSRRLRNLSREGQKQMAELYTNLQESIMAINITRAFNREKTEIERFKKINWDLYTLVMRFTKIEALSSPLMEFIGAFAVGLVLFFAGKDVISGVWSPGSFFAFFAAAFSIYQPIKNFANLNPQIQQAISASERIFELLNQVPEVSENHDAKELEPFKNEIEFKHVSFEYDKDDIVLKDVNFEVKSGEVVAIVGPSGSGKSTIINLLLRFYNPVKGTITLDGKDIKEGTLKSLRGQMSIVTQETILFNESIHYNISYGNPDATEEQIVNAAKLAQAHAFIEKAPNGYNTLVGERGVFLSGGEKQRIAIARALIRNPKILLLDEATSNLDAESEQLVQNALEKLMEGRTTLIIAHRLATIKKSDKIIVLENGSIVDTGTHEELFKKEGLYRRLHQLQII
ncbi:MAG: ABC transporter ATP-binding protein [Elusimicrobiota bacterium]|nr:ABC transporter ATP-binding protein/permease [Elusimicrobiota bacterium]